MSHAKNATKWMGTFFLTLLLMFCATAGHADDTEIYYGTNAGSGDINLLFLLDDSGSMSWCKNSQPCGDPSKVRMNILKNTFKTLLAGMNGNIHVGLGTFSGAGAGGGKSGNGGYILYPVRKLSAHLDGVTKSYSAIAKGADDGLQYSGNSSVSWNESKIDFPAHDKKGTLAGFIFRGLDVPSHVKIISAAIIVDPVDSQSQRLDLSSFYTFGSDIASLEDKNLTTDRTWTNGGEIVIPHSDEWTNDYGEIPVTAMVQEMINQSGWCGNNDVLFKFKNKDPNDETDRNIGSWESVEDNGKGQAAARLKVVWKSTPLAAGETSCGAMTQALHDANADASEKANGTMELTKNNVILQTDDSGTAKDETLIGGFRFISKPFAPADTISKSVLHLVGNGAKVSNGRSCYIKSNGGYDGPYQSMYCNNPQWHPQYDWVWLPQYDQLTSGNVTLDVSVVAGSSPITSATGNISNRSVLGTESFTLPVSDFNQGEIPLDVTNLLSGITGWKSAPLMFSISVSNTSLPNGSGNPAFYVGAVDGSSGAYMTFEVNTTDADKFKPTVRDRLMTLVDGLSAETSTPLAESYTEMARYMMGLGTNFGDGSWPDATSSPLSTVDADNNGVGDGDVYNSPIANVSKSCSTNAVVVMTDGRANSDGLANNQVNDIMGVSGTSSDSYKAMARLAAWLNKSNENTVNRQVSTHMIGFYLNSSIISNMKKVSDAGSGKTYDAQSSSELLDAFQSVVNSVVDKNSSMAAPGVAVNQLNRLENLKQVYYAVFKPKNVGTWPGNLKKYKLKQVNGKPEIVGANGSPAIDPNTGFFLNTSKSYWSNDVDGGDVLKGGARSQTGVRQLFITTSTKGHGSNPLDTSATGIALQQVSLQNPLSKVQLGNSGMSDSELTDLTQWVYSVWSDPLHSVPHLVNYGYSGSNYADALTDPSLQKNVIYVSDNAGMLHAVDAKTGEELFVFSPIEELHKDYKRWHTQKTGSPALSGPDFSRAGYYGLDGSWTVWRQANSNDLSTISSVYLYGGQRRGGRSYYALDVTDPGLDGTPNPKILWQISGANAASNSPFSLLGQTWSTPQLTRVRINTGTVDANGTPVYKSVPVLVFAGGYDTSNDSGTIPNTSGDDRGNAIYIVNAYTGALIWYASDGTKVDSGMSNPNYGYTKNDDMKWSVPGTPNVIDYNADGYADFIYFADMGGQVFRVDLDNFQNSGADSLVTNVETLAKLGISGGTYATNTDALRNSRRFFSQPSVALIKQQGRFLLRVVMGSGYRAHPLNSATNDWIYALDDTEALPTLAALSKGTTPSVDQPLIKMGELVDVTSMGVNATVTGIDDGTDTSASAHYYGWKFQLKGAGEKALSKPVIVNGRVVFTTFTTVNNTVNECTSIAGGSRLYMVGLMNGLGIQNGFPNSSTIPQTNGRAISINVQGIAPKPQILVTGDPSGELLRPKDLTAIIGTFTFDLGTLDQSKLLGAGWKESTQSEVNALFQDEGVQP